MNLLLVNRHKDSRRELVELEPPFSSEAVKVLHASEDCEVGHHFHKRKHEAFCLVSGSGESTIEGVTALMQVNRWLFVRQGVMHSFRLSKGSILLGLASRKFDPTDDYRA